MAGQGPAPKPPELRRNRNKKERGEWVTIHPRTEPVPEMPDGDWHERTCATWRAYWRDPASGQWTDADVGRLVELIALTDEFWQGKHQLAAEMRLRADALGLSQKGKRDLRWRLESDVPTPEQVAEAKASRRDSLKVV